MYFISVLQIGSLEDEHAALNEFSREDETRRVERAPANTIGIGDAGGSNMSEGGPGATSPDHLWLRVVQTK